MSDPLIPSNPTLGGDPERWETLGKEMVADCRVFRVARLAQRAERSGRRGDFFAIESADWVNVLALTPEGGVLLIRQYRHAAAEMTLEIPGGILDEGESPIEAARRELLEETGYEAARYEVIGRVRSNPAIIDNWTWTVLAEGAIPSVAGTSFDEHEEIALEIVPLEGVDRLLRDGAITHALVVDAFLWLRLHREGASGSPFHDRDLPSASETTHG